MSESGIIQVAESLVKVLQKGEERKVVKRVEGRNDRRGVQPGGPSQPGKDGKVLARSGTQLCALPCSATVYAALGQRQRRRACRDTLIGKPHALLIGRVFNVRLLVH